MLGDDLEESAAQLLSLGLHEVHVAGGPAAVSPAVETELKALVTE